ncbi:MAG TPA: hypothetical protein VFN61_10170 [Acidimicrobiales bacterium]|nr:hypothetical protein [Acidimicrobiales bacterium]
MRRPRHTPLAGWLSELFPPAARGTVPAVKVAGGYGLGFLAATLVAYLRQSGLAPARTFWAEDGAIFYAQAWGKSLLGDLVTSYNGYDQLVPRVGGEMARSVAVPDAPAVMAWGGAALLGLLCCLVYHMARGHIGSPAARLVLAASMPLLPIAIVEMLDNFVNVPWWMFFAAFWALLWRPQTALGRWVAAALCALAAASEPLVGLLAPLALARAVALRSPRQNTASIGLLAGLAFQGAVVIGALGKRPFHPKGSTQLVPDFLERVGLGWLSGLRGTDWVASGGRTLAVVLGASALLVVLVLGLTCVERSVRALTVAVIVLAPLCFFVPVWVRGVGDEMQAGASVGFSGRYAATPILMVIGLALAIAASAVARGGVRRRRGSHARSAPWRVGGLRGAQWAHRFGLSGAVLACLLALTPAWVVDFRDANARSAGPAWSSALKVASAECARRPARAVVGVPIDPPGMSVVIRCGDLEAGPQGRGAAERAASLSVARLLASG